MPMPAMASGTVIPPRAAQAGEEGRNMAEAARYLGQLLSGGQTGMGQGENTYTFIGQLDGKVLFQKVISLGQAQRLKTGKNPFMLGG